MVRPILFITMLLHMLPAQSRLVTVIVRPEPSARDSGLTVFIAGNTVQTGNWQPAAVSLERREEAEWRITIPADSGTVLQFKLTAGSWATEAYYDSGTTPRNTIIDVTKDTSVILRPLFWKRYILPKRPEPAIRGTVRYHRQLTGPGLNHARDIIVWLPPSYEKNLKKHYPVLYMHDGQNVFDPSTAFTGYD
ncbi:MAG: hypothetical protein HUU02_12685, partial [Bacteroidetes bacterium]|nr:hypothetical protein [Bacteroidota bacterium]